MAGQSIAARRRPTANAARRFGPHPRTNQLVLSPGLSVSETGGDVADRTGQSRISLTLIQGYVRSIRQLFFRLFGKDVKQLSKKLSANAEVVYDLEIAFLQIAVVPKHNATSCLVEAK
jgi:hypothetical protein